VARRGGATFECPNCGAEVRHGARSCPECGADDQTGWSEDTMYDGLDLPDPGYGEEERARPRKGAGRITRIVIVVAALAALAGFLYRLF
jgi:hypothetical protein